MNALTRDIVLAGAGTLMLVAALDGLAAKRLASPSSFSSAALPQPADAGTCRADACAIRVRPAFSFPEPR
jgi:hypothetical protein